MSDFAQQVLGYDPAFDGAPPIEKLFPFEGPNGYGAASLEEYNESISNTVDPATITTLTLTDDPTTVQDPPDTQGFLLGLNLSSIPDNPVNKGLNDEFNNLKRDAAIKIGD